MTRTRPLHTGDRRVDATTFVTLRRAAGTTVTCLAGDLWITRDGSPADVVLAPGERYRVADAARVIVTGLGPSRMRVEPPDAAPQAIGSPQLGRLLRALRPRRAGRVSTA